MATRTTGAASRIAAGLVFAGSLAGAPAAADTFPSRPIAMIVVFAPGGPTDVLARIVAEHMSRTLGQRVIVENLAGAGGTTGGARGAKAAPDGYTLTVGSLGSHGAAAALYKNIQYDSRELEPIGLIAGTPGYFVVRKDFPAQSFPEFVAHVRANPGTVTNGHAGVGSTTVFRARKDDTPWRMRRLRACGATRRGYGFTSVERALMAVAR